MRYIATWKKRILSKMTQIKYFRPDLKYLHFQKLIRAHRMSNQHNFHLYFFLHK